jgi:hypothetical protein
MSYLEVRVENGGSLAVSANGISLAKSNGCLAFFIGSIYPYATDYFNGLASEGWRLVSSQSNSAMAIVSGFPMGNTWGTYLFEGNGRYEIEWDENDRWHFKGRYISPGNCQDNYDDGFDDRYDEDQGDYDRYLDERADYERPY